MPMNTLEDLVAIVTGAASGLGAAIAGELGQAGAHVVMADVDDEGLERSAESLRAGGGAASPIAVDLLDSRSVDGFMQTVEARFTRLHLLVNAAGVMPVVPLEATAEEDWSWVLGVNLLGPARMVRSALPLLRRRAAGELARIVNIASMSGLSPFLGSAIGAYAASKSALITYSEVLAVELAAEGIAVSVACPGGIATRIFDSERSRPESMQPPTSDTATRSSPSPQAPESLMSAEEAARRIVEGIRSGRFYLFSHPADRARIEQRHEALIDDMESAQESVDARDAAARATVVRRA